MAAPQSPPGSRLGVPAHGHPRLDAAFSYLRPMGCVAPLSACLGDRWALLPLLPTPGMSRPARPGKHLAHGPQGRRAPSVSRRIRRDLVCTWQPASRCGSAPPTIDHLTAESFR